MQQIYGLEQLLGESQSDRQPFFLLTHLWLLSDTPDTGNMYQSTHGRLNTPFYGWMDSTIIYSYFAIQGCTTKYMGSIVHYILYTLFESATGGKQKQHKKKWEIMSIKFYGLNTKHPPDKNRILCSDL